MDTRGKQPTHRERATAPSWGQERGRRKAEMKAPARVTDWVIAWAERWGGDWDRALQRDMATIRRRKVLFGYYRYCLQRLSERHNVGTERRRK